VFEVRTKSKASKAQAREGGGEKTETRLLTCGPKEFSSRALRSLRLNLFRGRPVYTYALPFFDAERP
jgi:hypothetical protein